MLLWEEKEKLSVLPILIYFDHGGITRMARSVPRIVVFLIVPIVTAFLIQVMMAVKFAVATSYASAGCGKTL